MTLHNLKCRAADMSIIKEVWDAGVYERDYQVKFGDVIVDAGAQIGSFTVKVAKKAKKVIAFEPEPSNFDLLRINTRELENVEIHRNALWSSLGNAKLKHHRLKVGGHTLLNLSPTISGYEIDVETVRLDDVVNEVDFIKMDVEGAELEVLKGSKRILETQHPVIAMETHPSPPLAEWWRTLTEILYPFNYKILHFPRTRDMWQSRIITAL